MLQAIQRAIDGVTSGGADRAGGLASDGAVAGELFSPTRFRADRASYTLPSYDAGGTPTEVAVQTPEEPLLTDDATREHIERTFGRLAPSGQTFYGVMSGRGLYFSLDQQGQLDTFTISHYKEDKPGHWEKTGTEYVYDVGQYVFEVTGKAQGKKPLFENVGRVVDLRGKQIGDPIYTPQPVGFRIVFDVPYPIRTGAEAGGGRGGRGGGGILPGPGIIVLRCHPQWNTSPLTDPKFATMTVADMERLFLNLCNARAIHNMDLSERYIRDQVVPRFTGPNGATNLLSDYARHELIHFREDLELLKGLAIALNKLDHEIASLQAELDPLITRHHQTSKQFQAPLAFGAPHKGDVYWPTYQEPDPENVEKVEKLTTELASKAEQLRTVVGGIVLLVQEDPFLTQFIRGLEFSPAGRPSAGERESIGLEISEAPELTTGRQQVEVLDFAAAQKQILERLNQILTSIALARQKLCREPDRVLDLPLVYEWVQESVRGVNPAFDKVVGEMIRSHIKQEFWTDVGLGAAGLALFVGGLIISLAGGPAGVAAFLALSGTVLGGVTAIRSSDKAAFLTVISEASLQRGQGFVTLQAAQEARFWAKVDLVFLSVDVAVGALKGAKAILAVRQAEAAARVARGAAAFEESLQASRLLPFEELFRRAAPAGSLALSEVELAQLQQVGGIAAKGRITEEVALKTIGRSGEYLNLATKLNGNQGIDLLLIRRQAFEQIFGQLPRDADAARALMQATEEQQKQLARLLRSASGAENLVALEIKFSRGGKAIEEALNAARQGVQQNKQWYQGLMAAMRKAKNPEVRATGRLLEEVIGASAENIDRISRIGLSLDATGAFRLTRLTDRLIDLAYKSRRLYRSKNYFRLIAALMRVERAGDATRASQLRKLLQGINADVNQLDDTVRAIKAEEAARVAVLTERAVQAETASVRTQKALQSASQALRQIEALQDLVPTPAVLDSLFIANATASLQLQAARQGMAQMEAEDVAIEQSIAAIDGKRGPYDTAILGALEELERIKPGAKEEIFRFADQLQRDYPELTEPPLLPE